MAKTQPAKIFPLPFGDLRVDPNTLAQTIRVWTEDGSVNSFEDFTARLQRADPVLVAAAGRNAYIETWLESLYEATSHNL